MCLCAWVCVGGQRPPPSSCDFLPSTSCIVPAALSSLARPSVPPRAGVYAIRSNKRSLHFMAQW